MSKANRQTCGVGTPLFLSGALVMLGGCGLSGSGAQGGFNANICNAANSTGDCNQSGTNTNTAQAEVGGAEPGGASPPASGVPEVALDSKAILTEDGFPVLIAGTLGNVSEGVFEKIIDKYKERLPTGYRNVEFRVQAARRQPEVKPNIPAEFGGNQRFENLGYDLVQVPATEYALANQFACGYPVQASVLRITIFKNNSRVLIRGRPILRDDTFSSCAVPPNISDAYFKRLGGTWTLVRDTITVSRERGVRWVINGALTGAELASGPVVSRSARARAYNAGPHYDLWDDTKAAEDQIGFKNIANLARVQLGAELLPLTASDAQEAMQFIRFPEFETGNETVIGGCSVSALSNVKVAVVNCATTESYPGGIPAPLETAPGVFDYLPLGYNFPFEEGSLQFLHAFAPRYTSEPNFDDYIASAIHAEPLNAIYSLQRGFEFLARAHAPDFYGTNNGFARNIDPLKLSFVAQIGLGAFFDRPEISIPSADLAYIIGETGPAVLQLFSTGEPPVFPSALDSSIVLHEFGHGVLSIYERLDHVNLSVLSMAGDQGWSAVHEGFSDYLAYSSNLDEHTGLKPYNSLAHYSEGYSKQVSRDGPRDSSSTSLDGNCWGVSEYPIAVSATGFSNDSFAARVACNTNRIDLTCSNEALDGGEDPNFPGFPKGNIHICGAAIQAALFEPRWRGSSTSVDDGTIWDHLAVNFALEFAYFRAAELALLETNDWHFAPPLFTIQKAYITMLAYVTGARLESGQAANQPEAFAPSLRERIKHAWAKHGVKCNLRGPPCWGDSSVEQSNSSIDTSVQIRNSTTNPPVFEYTTGNETAIDPSASLRYAIEIASEPRCWTADSASACAKFSVPVQSLLTEPLHQWLSQSYPDNSLAGGFTYGFQVLDQEIWNRMRNYRNGSDRVWYYRIRAEERRGLSNVPIQEECAGAPVTESDGQTKVCGGLLAGKIAVLHTTYTNPVCSLAGGDYGLFLCLVIGVWLFGKPWCRKQKLRG